MEPELWTQEVDALRNRVRQIDVMMMVGVFVAYITMVTTYLMVLSTAETRIAYLLFAEGIGLSSWIARNDYFIARYERQIVGMFELHSASGYEMRTRLLKSRRCVPFLDLAAGSPLVWMLGDVGWLLIGAGEEFIVAVLVACLAVTIAANFGMQRLAWHGQ